MTKRLVDNDDDILASSQDALETASITEIVNAALTRAEPVGVGGGGEQPRICSETGELLQDLGDSRCNDTCSAMTNTRQLTGVIPIDQWIVD